MAPQLKAASTGALTEQIEPEGGGRPDGDVVTARDLQPLPTPTHSRHRSVQVAQVLQEGSADGPHHRACNRPTHPCIPFHGCRDQERTGVCGGRASDNNVHNNVRLPAGAAASCYQDWSGLFQAAAPGTNRPTMVLSARYPLLYSSSLPGLPRPVKPLFLRNGSLSEKPSPRDPHTTALSSASEGRNPLLRAMDGAPYCTATHPGRRASVHPQHRGPDRSVFDQHGVPRGQRPACDRTTGAFWNERMLANGAARGRTHQPPAGPASRRRRPEPGRWLRLGSVAPGEGGRREGGGFRACRRAHKPECLRQHGPTAC